MAFRRFARVRTPRNPAALIAIVGGAVIAGLTTGHLGTTACSGGFELSVHQVERAAERVRIQARVVATGHWPGRRRVESIRSSCKCLAVSGPRHAVMRSGDSIPVTLDLRVNELPPYVRPAVVLDAEGLGAVFMDIPMAYLTPR